MSVNDNNRIARAQGGSRRKRDLDAAARAGVALPQTEAERRSTEQRADDWDWAIGNLPDEDAAFAAGARSMERYVRRRQPSAAEVLARLRATGRDRESLLAKGGSMTPPGWVP